MKFINFFMRRIPGILFIAVLFLTTSCINMSSMQTGRTLPQGEFGYGGGGGFISHQLDFNDDEDDEDVFEDDFDLRFSMPFLEASFKYGITDKFDVGAKFTLIGTSSIDVKYQFWGDQHSTFAGSIGLGGAYVGIGNANIVDIIVPAYFSFHPVDGFAVYATPKYTLRSFEDVNTHWIGSSLGLRIGKENAFVIEAGYFQGSGVMNIFQVTAGIAVGIP
jgi:hypothetical protein